MEVLIFFAPCGSPELKINILNFRRKYSIYSFFSPVWPDFSVSFFYGHRGAILLMDAFTLPGNPLYYNQLQKHGMRPLIWHRPCSVIIIALVLIKPAPRVDA